MAYHIDDMVHLGMHPNLRKVIAAGIFFAFLVNTFGPIPMVQAQEFLLPKPGAMVPLSPSFNPPVLKGIKVHLDNPFRFDFILDKGDSRLSNVQLRDESSKLIKYFLASLTIPEKDLWVNLSPYEKNRIIPQSFGLTEMGRDLLAEDYMLKQITASLIYPEDRIGEKFWKQVYEEAAKKFGTTDIPVNTFNKIWIVPEKAFVYENAKAGTAYVVKSRLKVMLEQDYLSLEKHLGIQSDVSQNNGTNQLGSQIVREIVIPQLTKEVNEGKNFALLRQVYDSLILATWYKKKIKDSILDQIYANKNKVAGINIDDPQEKEKIYQQYLRAFKKGVFNYIKEDVDLQTNQPIAKKYFSGGMDLAMNVTDLNVNRAVAIVHHMELSQLNGNFAMVSANLKTVFDQAMVNVVDGFLHEHSFALPAIPVGNMDIAPLISPLDHHIMNSPHRPCCWLLLFLSLGILIGHFLPFPLIYWLWASVILIILNWIPAYISLLLRRRQVMTRLNEGVWSLYAAIFCLGAALIHVAHPPAMEPLRDWQVQLKQSFYQYLDPDEAGTMSAIVLGDRNQIPKEIKMSLQRSGTGHVVVTAGIHCAMMVTIVIFVLKLIRIPRLFQGGLSILLIFTYALLTGGSIPVMRAAFTASILLASYIFELESDSFNSLCAAALLILLMNADNLFDTSFQLSFAAVAAIILLCKPIEEMLSFLPRWMSVALAVSTSAWIGITPVQTLSFWHYYANWIDCEFIYRSFVRYYCCFGDIFSREWSLDTTDRMDDSRVCEGGF